MPALQTRNIAKYYGTNGSTIKAVDDVSISIESGEFVALVGPSGSGKTTMLALLAGLLEPSDGAIIINEENMVDLNDRDRTRFRRENIGFVFQASNLVPYLTARENIELMLKLNGGMNGKGAGKVDQLVERLGLEDRQENLPGALSGGQRQRVAIARALIHSPKVVLADEPTASLDTERAYQVVETFADLIHEQNRAGIMVTHDLRMCRFVDKVIQMRDGKLAEILTDPDDIRALASRYD